MDVENWENDEIDDFANARDEVLLKKAGWSKKKANGKSSGDHQLEDEESVLDIESAKERYLKQLQGPISDSEEEYFVDKDKDVESGDEEDEQWGGKGDYYGNESASEEEDVAEALRLQQKHMADLEMGDYMLEEVEEEWKAADKEEEQKEEFEKLKQGNNESDDLIMLKNRYPEYLPLLKEYCDLRVIYDELEADEQESSVIKRKALGGYLGTIICYLGLLKGKAENGESMKDESVMMGILRGRELWRLANELGTVRVEHEAGEDDEDEMEVETGGSAQDVEEESEDEDEGEEEEEEEDEEEEEGNKDFASVRKIRHLKKSGIDSLEEEEHRGRRKTLRFYTSKIEQKGGNKPQFTGDDDLSYQETEFERKVRLGKEAKKRGESMGPGEDL